MVEKSDGFAGGKDGTVIWIDFGGLRGVAKKTFEEFVKAVCVIRVTTRSFFNEIEENDITKTNTFF